MPTSRSPAASRARSSGDWMPSLTKWNVVPPAAPMGHASGAPADDPVWNGASSGHACSPTSNMRLPIRSRRCARTSPTRCRCRAPPRRLAELQVLAHEPQREHPLLQFHPLPAHQLLGGLGAMKPVQRHRHAEEHLPGHQSSTRLRTISVTSRPGAHRHLAALDRVVLLDRLVAQLLGRATVRISIRVAAPSGANVQGRLEHVRSAG